jgi:hypothetical protein
MSTDLQAPPWHKRLLTDEDCPEFAYNPADPYGRPFLSELQPRWQPVRGRHPTVGGESLIAGALDQIGLTAFYEALAFPYRSRSPQAWVKEVVPDFYVPSLHCIFEETSGRGGSGLRAKSAKLRRIAATHHLPCVLVTSERLLLLKQDPGVLLRLQKETVRRQRTDEWP